MQKGAFHVHSVFSDGEESLERIAEVFRAAGMDFIAVSDHAEVFDDKRMLEYVERCHALSDSQFLVVPGLEFAVKFMGIHILGYGITRRVNYVDMDDLVNGIHDAGGVAVLAHPPHGSINMIGSIKEKLDGIEVWNGRYDGTVTPRADSFQLLRRVRSLNAKAAAYCGIDLHKLSQARNMVYAEVESDRLEHDSIVSALRAGAFKLCGRNLTIPSTGNLTFVQELSIAVRQPLCRPWAA
jgi:hypothetical protein